MRKIRLLWRIFKSVKADRIIIGFMLFILLFAYLFTLIEPSIKSYSDGLWYAFSIVTTIGFGDYYAVTSLGRLLTMILGVYGILVVGLIPGILVSYYLEFTKLKTDETMGEFLDKLERLEELSKEELKAISDKIKKNKYRI